MKETYRHKGLRRQLVAEIKAKGITDEATLAAMLELPRHFFLDKAFEEQAYTDKAFPIGKEQTISQPYTVAYMTALLDIETRSKVLEIGTGSGYQAALLALMGARVFTVERHEELFLRTKDLFKQLKFTQIRSFFRDGSEGLPEFAPFDRIIVTAAAPSVSEVLKQQLAVNGIMVAPIGDDAGQNMVRVRRLSDTEFEETHYERFRFVPFLSGLSRV